MNSILSQISGKNLSQKRIILNIFETPIQWFECTLSYTSLCSCCLCGLNYYLTLAINGFILSVDL